LETRCIQTLNTPLSRAQGFGRGGRLGHPEEKYHSGQEAVMLPRAVEALQGHAVRTVAAAKHHTLAVTADGALFAWGRNRDGQLGTGMGGGSGGAGADGYPTPRLVTALKPFTCVGTAAAHCHSVAVTSAGALYAWGGNRYVAVQRIQRVRHELQPHRARADRVVHDRRNAHATVLLRSIQTV